MNEKHPNQKALNGKTDEIKKKKTILICTISELNIDTDLYISLLISEECNTLDEVKSMLTRASSSRCFEKEKKTGIHKMKRKNKQVNQKQRRHFIKFLSYYYYYLR